MTPFSLTFQRCFPDQISDPFQFYNYTSSAVVLWVHDGFKRKHYIIRCFMNKNWSGHNLS